MVQVLWNSGALGEEEVSIVTLVLYLNYVSVHFMCVCMMCVSVGVHVPWHMCRGQKTGSGSDPLPSTCLRWDHLPFTTVPARLVSLPLPPILPQECWD